jgi:hypothetical protein
MTRQEAIDELVCAWNIENSANDNEKRERDLAEILMAVNGGLNAVDTEKAMIFYAETFCLGYEPPVQEVAVRTYDCRFSKIMEFAGPITVLNGQVLRISGDKAYIVERNSEADLELIGWQWAAGAMKLCNECPGLWKAWVQHAKTLHPDLTDSKVAKAFISFAEAFPGTKP